MTRRDKGRSTRLRSVLAYLERELARRAKGTQPGMVRFQDDELHDLVEVLRREVGATSAAEPVR